MKKYKGFKIGQNVTLNTINISDSIKFNPGHNFNILDFPPCVYMPNKYNAKYFIFGKDQQGNIIRCDTSEINKHNG